MDKLKFNDSIKIFDSLIQEKITSDPQLLDILDLNGEQLTYYFEEELIENPFVEFEYPIEAKVGNLKKNHIHGGGKLLDPQSPSVAHNLLTFIYEQIMLYRETPIRDTMLLLVDYMDEKGYIPYTYQELSQKLDIDPMVVLDAVTLLQQMEPAGIAAYDLKECLMLQTEQDPHAPAVAYYLLETFFEELTQEDYTEIKEKTNLSMEEIQTCVNYYHTLRPSPASLFERPSRINSIPDVKVVIEGNEVQIRFNRQYYPRLSFNQTYFNEMLEKKDESLNEYILPHHQNFLSLVDALRIREELITEVAKAIVVAQKDFFAGEGKDIAPLLLKDIAARMRLSEAIVRVIVMNKNLSFNNVVYAFTDFINVTAKIGRSGLSALNVKNSIRELIQAQPDITNTEIKESLAEDKIMISEHLVVRYRHSIEKENQTEMP